MSPILIGERVDEHVKHVNNRIESILRCQVVRVIQ